MKKISQPTKITHHQISCTPIPELGETFEGFYHKGKKAIKKLLQEKRGQITGAFYNNEIGDIDLVWGKIINKQKKKGMGLVHILNKHPDFDLRKIPKIIKKGKLEKTYNGYNIIYKKTSY